MIKDDYDDDDEDGFIQALKRSLNSFGKTTGNTGKQEVQWIQLKRDTQRRGFVERAS